MQQENSPILSTVLENLQIQAIGSRPPYQAAVELLLACHTFIPTNALAARLGDRIVDPFFSQKPLPTPATKKNTPNNHSNNLAFSAVSTYPAIKLRYWFIFQTLLDALVKFWPVLSYIIGWETPSTIPRTPSTIPRWTVWFGVTLQIFSSIFIVPDHSAFLPPRVHIPPRVLPSIPIH